MSEADRPENERRDATDGDATRAGPAARRVPPDDRCERIEQLITLLVQTAPRLDAAVVEELIGQLQRLSEPIVRPLARSIARVVELVAEQLIAPGIALPPLAMACAALADGVRGTVGARELEAARYEIDTLLPMPDRPPAITPPSVPLSALVRRPPR